MYLNIWDWGSNEGSKFLKWNEKKLKALMGKNVISSCNGTVFTAEMWGN